jgi:hypothetical protein
MRTVRGCAPRYVAAFITGSAATVLLAGCGLAAGTSDGAAAATTPSSPPPIGLVPTITSAADKALPLDGYLLTDQQWKTIDSAENSAETRCMARFGMTLPPEPATTTAPSWGPGSQLRVAGHYGPQSLSFAQKWGYHPEGGLGASSIHPVGAPQTADYRTALMGTDVSGQKFGPGGQTINGQVVPEHGCIGEAKKEISGDINNTGNMQVAQDMLLQTES